MKKLAISTGLVAKGAAGAAAVATTTSLGVVYRDSIFGWGITNGEINEKLEGLGLPVNCKFSNEEERSKECGSMSEEALKKINFKDGKASNALGAADDTRTLTLERADDWEIFPDGFKLIFKTTADLTIVINGETSYMKKGTNTEFKIMEKEKKIERAWTVKNIGERVGITCSSDTSCTLGEKINVWRGDNDYVTDAKVEGANKSITVAKDSENHNEGFKFTVSSDISLSGGTQKKTANGIDKLTNNNVSYEIGIKEIGGQKIWFLIEKKRGGN